MTQSKPRPQREFDFTLVLKDVSELTFELADRIFEAGCDDATVSQRSCRIFLRFSRAAGSMQDAITSAIADLRHAGFEVESMSRDSLMA
jgi:hypothetical protein